MLKSVCDPGVQYLTWSASIRDNLHVINVIGVGPVAQVGQCDTLETHKRVGEDDLSGCVPVGGSVDLESCCCCFDIRVACSKK